MPEQLTPYMPLIMNVITAIATLIIGFWFAGLAERWTVRSLTKAKVDQALHSFLGGLVRYTVIAAAVIATLGAFGIETTSVVAIFASAGLAVGLALQGTLAHFASGVMILFFRPFTIGDKITAGGHTGDVEAIGLFATTLADLDGKRYIVPNGAIMGGSITNITGSGKTRGSVGVGVAYGTDFSKAQEVFIAAALESPFVLGDEGVGVACVGLGGSSVDFLVHVWSKPADFLSMMDDVTRRVHDACNASGIDIPYPHVVHLTPES